jgi:hypothetical protein
MEEKSVELEQLNKREVSSIHDEFVRAVFSERELIIEFLRFYVGKTEEGLAMLGLLDLEGLESQETHFFDSEGHQRIADLIFNIPLKDKSGGAGVIFVFEHKSFPSRSLPFQLLKYLDAIWHSCFLAVRSHVNIDFVLPAPLLIVLHNGATKIKVKPMLCDYVAKVPGTAKFIPTFDYMLVDLPALLPEELGTAPLLRVVLELLKRATDGTLYDVRKQILEPLSAIRDDARTRERINRIMRYTGKVLKSSNIEFTRDIANDFLRPIFGERSDEMIMSCFDEVEAKGIAIGKAEGIAIGEAKGEAKGEVKGRQRSVLDALRVKFRGVSKRIEDEVLQISDPDVLRDLIVDVIRSQTLDDFVKVLK